MFFFRNFAREDHQESYGVQSPGQSERPSSEESSSRIPVSATLYLSSAGEGSGRGQPALFLLLEAAASLHAILTRTQKAGMNSLSSDLPRSRLVVAPALLSHRAPSGATSHAHGQACAGATLRKCELLHTQLKFSPERQIGSARAGCLSGYRGIVQNGNVLIAPSRLRLCPQSGD
jgi:hypothetical protein